MLKSLYPEKLNEKLKNLSKDRIRVFCLVNGTKEIYNLLLNEQYVAWKMIQFQENKVKEFQNVRKKYLLY
jgi:uncharacterized protein YbbC (DUF1343 family)